MRTLWLRMAEIYAHRWTSGYGEDCEQGAGATWAKGLAGITGKQLAIGLSAALASSDPWPPTLPEFRSMCMGIPSFAAVKHELRTSTSRSPFLRQVWEFIDGYLFARADAERADRMLRDAYALAAEYVMRGGHLPEPIEGGIEHQRPAKHERPVRAPVDVAKPHIDAINEMLNASAPDGEMA